MAEDPPVGPFALPETWVHADQPPAWSDLADQATAFARWRLDDWTSLERLHALDRAARETHEGIGVLGLHAGPKPPAGSADRVRDVLLARGAWAPTGLSQTSDELPVADPGGVAVVAAGELVETFDPQASLDAIVAELEDLAGPGSRWQPRGAAPGPWPLAYPFDVAVGGSRLAAADTGHNRVLVARPGGQIVHLVGDGVPEHVDGSLSEARFQAPRGVCWRGETLLVADTGNDAIREVDAARDEVTTLVQAPEGSLPAGLALTGSGEVAVALAGEGRLARLDDGDLSSHASDASGVHHPVDVEPEGDDLLLADLAGARVGRVEPDGSTACLWEGGPLVEPSGVLARATPLVADAGAGTVLELPGEDGQPSELLDGVPGLAAPVAVAREADRLVIGDGGGHHLWRFEPGAEEPLSRVRLTESPLSLTEHIRLDPVEMAPGGRLELSISYVLPEGPSPDTVAPPRARGPVRDLRPEGEPEREEGRIRTLMTGRVAASGNLRIRWSLTQTHVGHEAAWDLPVVVRPGAERELRLALSTSPA